jgi:hypothetical protein
MSIKSKDFHAGGYNLGYRKPRLKIAVRSPDFSGMHRRI